MSPLGGLHTSSGTLSPSLWPQSRVDGLPEPFLNSWDAPSGTTAQAHCKAAAGLETFLDFASRGSATRVLLRSKPLQETRGECAFVRPHAWRKVITALEYLAEGCGSRLSLTCLRTSPQRTLAHTKDKRPLADTARALLRSKTLGNPLGGQLGKAHSCTRISKALLSANLVGGYYSGLKPYSKGKGLGPSIAGPHVEGQAVGPRGKECRHRPRSVAEKGAV